MDKIRSSKDLADRLDVAITAIKLENRLSNTQQEVGKIMDAWPNDRGVYAQLQRLAEFIAQTRAEISALRPSEVKDNFIPTASDELDAIVEATAEATNRIMDAADVVMDVVGKLPPEDTDRVMAAVTSIYEACSFQDITGQRVTKIIGVLKVIEGRVDKLVDAMGGSSAASAAGDPRKQEREAPVGAGATQAAVDDMFSPEALEAERRAKDADLLNGPALPGEGTSQADVDAILRA